jgi:hypothetical protein
MLIAVPILAVVSFTGIVLYRLKLDAAQEKAFRSQLRDGPLDSAQIN